jgi:predicted dehydrogenase
MLRDTRLGRALKDAVASGQVGDPVFLNLASLGAPDAGPDGDDPLLGPVDLACWLMADVPEQVQARESARGAVRHRSICLRFPRGRVALVELSSGRSADAFERVLLLGTLGRLTFDSAEAPALLLAGKEAVLPGSGLAGRDPVGAAGADDAAPPPEAAASVTRAVRAALRGGQPVRPGEDAVGG